MRDSVQAHTSKEESGTVGPKLSPEAGEKVDELECRNALLAHKGRVHGTSNVEQGHHLHQPDCWLHTQHLQRLSCQ